MKLIVSDMDGTLLNSQEKVSELFFELFYQLQKLGVHFVAASGRQYNSIIHKLNPVKNDITVIAENGGMAKRKDDVWVLQTLNPKKIAAIIPTLRSIENIFIILCGKDTAYVESTDEHLIAMFKEYYGNHKMVEDLTKVVYNTDFLKIALYHSECSEKNIYPKVRHLKDELLLKISGKNWLDISNPEANKGNALQVVQEKLNITQNETLAFGDYLNDIEMLQRASFSYAMKNAHDDVKKTARFTTESNNDFGVEKVLQQVIRAKLT